MAIPKKKPSPVSGGKAKAVPSGKKAPAKKGVASAKIVPVKKPAKKITFAPIQPIRRVSVKEVDATSPMAQIEKKSAKPFDADAEDRALGPALIIFAGLVYDKTLSTMGAAGMNHIVHAKIIIREADGKKEELEMQKKLVWQLFTLATAYYSIARYTGVGAQALRRAIVQGWEREKISFDEKGISDQRLLQLATDMKVLGQPPSAPWEAVADSIARKYGLVGASG